MEIKNIFKRFMKKRKPSNRFRLLKVYSWGAFDSITIEKCRLLRIEGHFSNENPDLSKFHVLINDVEISCINDYKIFEKEYTSTNLKPYPLTLFILEYFINHDEFPNVFKVNIFFEGKCIFQLNKKVNLVLPHYSHLFFSKNVLHRENIYGYGPPSMEVSAEVLEWSKSLPTPIIDFGCGSGALVKTLRADGMEAYGVELQRTEILDSLLEEVKPFITIYNGNFPLHFENNKFEGGICTEVLEHIVDFEEVIKELTRIINKRLIITVPDMSAIPLLHQFNVVPWHLLEATHVNFFTQRSLSCVLKEYFPKVEFSRIGPVVINGIKFYTSIVADCQK